MKVLAITPQYLPVPGGIEILVDALAEQLRHGSVETVVVTDTVPNGELPRRDIVNDTVVHRLDFFKALQSRGPTAPLEILQQLTELVAAAQPDIIHMHSAVQASAWYVARLLRKRPRPPIVVTQHGVLARADELGVVRELLLKADVLTAVSQAVLQSAIRFSGRVTSSAVIYNGLRQLNGIAGREPTDAKFRLSCIGRLEPGKGFDTAITALAEVRARGLDARLAVIGAGAQRRPLQELAVALGVTDDVHFEGVLDRRRTLEAIAGSSLVLVPSRLREGFSMVAAEAALCGVTCVASRVGGLPEVVEDGVTGVLVAPDDPDGLASAIVDLLQDSQRRRALGANARRRACQKFALDRCVDGFLSVYRSLMRPEEGKFR
jgi:glycosyltransferase involved in cell wall biosynthesis